jgi:hypothetical protein
MNAKYSPVRYVEIYVLVGDHFKLVFSVIITSNMSLRKFESSVTNKINVLQHRCSLPAIFLTFLAGNFLVIHNNSLSYAVEVNNGLRHVGQGDVHSSPVLQNVYLEDTRRQITLTIMHLTLHLHSVECLDDQRITNCRRTGRKQSLPNLRPLLSGNEENHEKQGVWTRT